MATKKSQETMDKLLVGDQYHLVITGRPASKKNNRRNFRNVSLPSKAYERFREEALWQLKQYKIPTIDQWVRVDYHFHIKGKYKQDWDNASGSIGDVLQDAEIIKDDWLIEEGHVTRTRGAKEWKTEITISLLTGIE